MKTELWKPVRDYDGIYEVSDAGRVRRVRSGRILKTRRSDGYGVASLCREGEYEKRLVHRMVLEAFVGPCPDGAEGCHFDGDPNNNALSNLRWDTRKKNIRDMLRHGRGTIKLSNADVLAALDERRRGATQAAVAKKYGVARTYLSAIENGHYRSFVTGVGE